MSAPAARAGRPTPSDHVARAELRVIYGDTDQMGVVYYANFLRWFEASRAQYLRDTGLSYAEVESRFDLMLPVSEAHVRYRRPARYEDVVVVQARMTELGWASLRFEYEVRRGADLLADGWTVHACIDREGHVRRFPREVITLFGGRLPS